MLFSLGDALDCILSKCHIRRIFLWGLKLRMQLRAMAWSLCRSQEKKAKPGLAVPCSHILLLYCSYLKDNLVLSNPKDWKKEWAWFEFAHHWTLVHFFVFLCSTTVELADLANCICIFLYFSSPVWSWLMWLIETRLRAKSVAILHLAFPLRYFQMTLLKAALIISSEDFEKKIKALPHQRFFCLINDHDL